MVEREGQCNDLEKKNYAILRKKKCRIEEKFAKHKEIKAKIISK